MGCSGALRECLGSELGPPLPVAYHRPLPPPQLQLRRFSPRTSALPPAVMPADCRASAVCPQMRNPFGLLQHRGHRRSCPQGTRTYRKTAPLALRAGLPGLWAMRTIVSQLSGVFRASNAWGCCRRAERTTSRHNSTVKCRMESYTHMMTEVLRRWSHVRSGGM